MADHTSYQKQRQNENTAKRILTQHVWKTFENQRFPEEWRHLPEVPSMAEICPPSKTLSDVSDSRYAQDKNPTGYQAEPLYDHNLPHNIIDGPWPSKEAYLGAHYQILREDAIAPLRRAVDEFKKSPTLADGSEICVYKDVTIVGVKLSRIGVGFRFTFSPQRQIKWKNSKRLLQGTMVALSKDLFRTECKIAIVIGRGLKSLADDPPSIELLWANSDDAVIDPVNKYVIIEAREGYFEASRHILVAMQKLMTEKFELQDHIVRLNRDIKAPTYVEDQPLMDLSSLEQDDGSSPRGDDPDRYTNVDVIRDFPKDMQSSMDKSQMTACQRMLTSTIAIIQGPPGTGKTYTSVSALKVMIKNWRPGDPPIVISAQTNHALDQLLNHILAFEPNILRLGGRSNKANEEIIKRTLFELRMANQIPRGRSGFREAEIQFDKCKRDMNDALETLTTENLLSGEALMKSGLITESQYKSLSAGFNWEGDESISNIAQWLGDEQSMPVPETSPLNLGLEIEQGDIEEEDIEDIDDEFKTDAAVGANKADDDEELAGDKLLFKRKFTGRHSNPPTHSVGKIKKQLASCKNLYDIPRAHRGEVYRFLEIAMNKNVLKLLKARLKEYQEAVNGWTITKHMASICLIRHLDIKVIGCTTTGLPKYRALLSAVEPRVLLIEEAAETLEGNVIGGLMNSIQHLILVGDHQQLQANCTVRALELKPYYMNISMFERLVNNSIGYVMLNVQRRMIQDVRKLLSRPPRPFYEDLQDHPSVLDRLHNRPPVPGMGGRDTYFFHHSWPDAKNSEASRYNLDEAQFIARFFLYLCQNGTDPRKITVLTFYNGQKVTLISELNALKALSNVRPFKVFTVDSYQGEENDIILLSLVRANSSSTIGFMESKNRLVVALSRARRGLYIFGSTITLMAGETHEDFKGREPLWSPLVNYMIAQRRLDIDGGLPVTCGKHRKITRLYEYSHFDKVLNGGCDVLCGGTLPCGHPCEKLCHPCDHEDVDCRVACPLTLTCGHKCSRTCSAKCFCDGCGLYDGQFRVPEYFSEVSCSPAWGQSPTKYSEKSPVSDHPAKKRVEFVAAEKSTDGRSDQANGRQPSTQALPPRPVARQLFNFSENRNSPESGATCLSTPIKPRPVGPRGSTYSSQTSIVRNVAFGQSNLSPVSPEDWKNWDAKKADEELAEQHRLEEAVAPKVDRSQLVFNETYIPTSLNSKGERVITSGPRRRTVGRNVLEYASLDTVVRYGGAGGSRNMDSDARHDRIMSPTELHKAKARTAAKALVDVTGDMSNLPKNTLLPAFGDTPDSIVGSKFFVQHVRKELENLTIHDRARSDSNDWCTDDWPAIDPSEIFGAEGVRGSAREHENLSPTESARGNLDGRGSFRGAVSTMRGRGSFGTARLARGGAIQGNNYAMRGRGDSRGRGSTRAGHNQQGPHQPVMDDLLGLDDSPVATTTSPVVGDLIDMYSASPPRRRAQRTESASSAEPKTPEQNPAPTMHAPRTPDDDEVFEERLINLD